MGKNDNLVPSIVFGIILLLALLYYLFDLHPMLFFLVESILIVVLIHYIVGDD